MSSNSRTGARGEALIARDVLLDALRARERTALADLVAIAGGHSLCSLSRDGATVPAVKYHEGAVAALGEARRAVEVVVDGPDSEYAARAALLEVRARWRVQSRSKGRAGPSWTGYLTGGLDSLQQMIEHDGGTDAFDAQN